MAGFESFADGLNALPGVDAGPGLGGGNLAFGQIGIDFGRVAQAVGDDGVNVGQGERIVADGNLFGRRPVAVVGNHGVEGDARRPDAQHAGGIEAERCRVGVDSRHANDYTASAHQSASGARPGQTPASVAASLQQRPEAGLLEVVVARERVRNAFALQDDE